MRSRLEFDEGGAGAAPCPNNAGHVSISPRLASTQKADASVHTWQTLEQANQEALQAGGLREGMMLEIPSHDEPDVHVQLVGAGAR